MGFVRAHNWKLGKGSGLRWHPELQQVAHECLRKRLSIKQAMLRSPLLYICDQRSYPGRMVHVSRPPAEPVRLTIEKLDVGTQDCITRLKSQAIILWPNLVKQTELASLGNFVIAR